MIYKVVFPNSEECKSLSEDEFEKALKLKLAHGLKFQDENLYLKVKRHCLKASNKHLIVKRQKWLGEFFSKEIRKDLMPDLVIRYIDDKIGYGVFANCDIPAFSYIGEYTGLLKKKRWFADKRNNYCFVYTIVPNHGSGFVIDAEKFGNHTRFINHGKTPNLEPVSVYCDGVMHIILRSIRPVQKGEQLTYDYGEEYWSKRKKSLCDTI